MAYAKRTFNVAAGNATLFTGGGGLYGITIRETTAVAVPVTVTVRDNTAASGPVLAVLRLVADGSKDIGWSKGVRFGTGLNLAVTGGDVQGSLIVGGPGGLRALPFAGVDVLLHTVATAGPINVDSILASETAGAAAEWRLFDNTSVTGQSFVGRSLAANESVHLSVGQGLNMNIGVQYDQLSGACSGAVYVF